MSYVSFVALQRLLSSATLMLLFSGTVFASSITPPKPKVLLQDASLTATPGPEIGTWDFEVDLEKEEVIVKPVSALPGVKVAGLLGSPSASFGSTATVYNNTALQLTNDGTFASASLQIRILNQSGTTLGQASPTDASKITGVKLLLVPRSDCPTGTPTLAQPICVVSNSSRNLNGTGLSGRNNGTDPVYLAYIPRDGNSLAALDDANPPERNEPTALSSPTDYARSVWRPDLAIPNGQIGTFGLRFRYAQDQAGTGQPRVTQFTYRLRVLAERPSGIAPIGAAVNNYVTTLAGNSGFSVPINGIGSSARLTPNAIAVSPDGTTLYVTNPDFSRIQVINVATQAVTILNNTTLPTGLSGVAVSPDGASLYVTSFVDGISRIDLNNPQVRLPLGSFFPASGVAISPDGATLYGTTGSQVLRINTSTGQSTVFSILPQQIGGLAISPDGATLYGTSGNQVLMINTNTGQVTTLPISTSLQIGRVAISPNGATLYGTSGNQVFSIDTVTGQVTTLAGSNTAGFRDGPADVAQFNIPRGVTVTPNGATVYVADISRIRAIQAIEGQSP